MTITPARGDKQTRITAGKIGVGVVSAKAPLDVGSDMGAGGFGGHMIVRRSGFYNQRIINRILDALDEGDMLIVAPDADDTASEAPKIKIYTTVKPRRGNILKRVFSCTLPMTYEYDINWS